MHRRLGALLGAALVVSACVGSSSNDADYVSKADKTAAAVRSSVQTVVVALQVVREGGAYDPYLSRLIGQAENDATQAVGSFDVVQPPSDAADDVRTELNSVTGDAVDVLTEARIAIRRSDEDGVVALADRLGSSAEALEAFKDAHS
ncbi:MAG: hypothetical protein ACR2LQ_12785 [Acidimicrobiales bacterium]